MGCASSVESATQAHQTSSRGASKKLDTTVTIINKLKIPVQLTCTTRHKKGEEREGKDRTECIAEPEDKLVLNTNMKDSWVVKDAVNTSVEIMQFQILGVNSCITVASPPHPVSFENKTSGVVKLYNNSNYMQDIIPSFKLELEAEIGTMFTIRNADASSVLVTFLVSDTGSNAFVVESDDNETEHNQTPSSSKPWRYDLIVSSFPQDTFDAMNMN